MIINRMYLVIFCAGAGLFLSVKTYAQGDTIRLEPVTVKGFVPEKFMSGLKIQKIDSASLAQFQFQNIGSLLSLYTPIAFKTYGPGQLSTASFRGTSANHTAVLWNGLNINVPSLGQTDFSTVPITGFDRLSVQYGSAASVVGSDAVGGSILLESSPTMEALNVSLGRQQESFGNNQTQISAKYRSQIHNSWTFSGKTAAYHVQLKNHFPYSERRQYPLLPSETLQRGLVQDLFFQSKNNQEISAHLWLAKNRLTLTPDDIAGRELTMTEAYRTMIRYRLNDLTIRTSWVRDIIDYAKGDFANPDHAVTDKFSNRVEKDFHWKTGQGTTQVQINVGGEWTHYRARIAGYEKPLITENRGDFFLLTRWQVSPRILISANLRQALVTRFNPPFTPSIGGEYALILKKTYTLKLKGSYSRSYRVPTLNERYWKELGNPTIKPETGWNKEMGLDQSYKLNDNQSLTSSITAYHNRIKDWTYWNPTKNYRVENLQQVLARGIELQLGWRNNFGQWKSGLNTGYALNNSSQEKAYDAYSSDIVGKQLVFVPLHSGNVIAFIQHKKTRVTAQGQAVSKRFITFDNSQYLAGYTLVNLLAETTFSRDGMSIRVQGQVNNIANTFYLNVRNNAMPGRNFAVNVVLGYSRPSSP